MALPWTHYIHMAWIWEEAMTLLPYNILGPCYEDYIEMFFCLENFKIPKW